MWCLWMFGVFFFARSVPFAGHPHTHTPFPAQSCWRSTGNHIDLYWSVFKASKAVCVRADLFISLLAPCSGTMCRRSEKNAFVHILTYTHTERRWTTGARPRAYKRFEILTCKWYIILWDINAWYMRTHGIICYFILLVHAAVAAAKCKHIHLDSGRWMPVTACACSSRAPCLRSLYLASFPFACR